ncbi:hypothetical protein SAMN05216338_1011166 [Bradyrhizobium sp. Rc2d]|uniref:hypothetical protein n=1 Tax=Bradyrhizobium sp. Rc2d TaxID=1855321 RepID=UPI0008885120|nr:hypothetical protein [Bradyrhizobium sp. Rc2d]SDH65484.1 hypothetical protein SAMN05216338_1011166 [Bradyrhizobium sp. Rc2d]
MKQLPKEQRGAEALRLKIDSLLAAPYSWRGYEPQRQWLEKLLQRDHSSAGFTPAERDAVARIAYMRTPFEGWDGYSVPELIKGALQYSADYDYDEELLLREIASEQPIALVRDQMRTLIGLCRAGGMDLSPFDARPDKDDGEAA